MDKKTLVIGASLNESRYSHLAVKKLVDSGIPIVAIGLKKGVVDGVTIETDMMDYKNIDTITLYLNPRRQVQYYDYIVGLQPRRVIFNPGTENPQFYKILQKAGIEVEVACTLVLLSTKQY